MTMNMFVRLIVLYLFLFQIPFTSATRYGAYCYSDSDCDQHQKCSNGICLCNKNERRFWTGTMCAICATGYTVTSDRCYKHFNELKTWDAARTHCRAQYADLFTWRDNHDEQFIRPVMQQWVTSAHFAVFWKLFFGSKPPPSYLAWAAATVTSFQPHTIKWMDPDGMAIDLYSKQWCDPTRHAGYESTKEPTLGSRESSNGTEREGCVTFNFYGHGTSFLCLADDYCSKKYPFICEMNAASMKLATSVHHGTNGDISSGTDTESIDFEEPPPPPPTELPFNLQNTDPNLEALNEEKSFLSTTNIIIFAGIGFILIVGAIAGYMVIQNRKKSAVNDTRAYGSASQGRPSFVASIGSMAEE